MNGEEESHLLFSSNLLDCELNNKYDCLYDYNSIDVDDFNKIKDVKFNNVFGKDHNNNLY